MGSGTTRPTPCKRAADAHQPVGFTLVELLVVISIIALLASLLLPALSRAKSSARTSLCLSNARQIGMATRLYAMENQDFLPQTKRTESNPEQNDADGSIEDPDLGSVFVPLLPFISTFGGQNENLQRQKVFACPADPNPFDPLGPSVYNPGGPWLVSYLVNGYFIWGMKECAIQKPAACIIYSERRSVANQNPYAEPFSDDSYKPWFYPPSNAQAPENDMDASTGAIQTQRHARGAVYSFCDSHAQCLRYSRTFEPPNLNLHKPY